MSRYSKGLAAVPDFARRWLIATAKRVHRVFDARDTALADAIKNVEARSDSVYPAILEFDANLGTLSKGGGAVTLGLVGTNLVGLSQFAQGATKNSAGLLSFQSRVPGRRVLTVTITNTGVALAVTANVAAGTITVVHGDGGASTAAAIKAAIDAHAVAKYLVDVTVTTAGNMDADEVVSVRTTSADPGTMPYITLGDVPVDGATADFGIVTWTDTAATFDVDANNWLVGDGPVLRIWVDDVLVIQHVCAIVA